MKLAIVPNVRKQTDIVVEIGDESVICLGIPAGENKYLIDLTVAESRDLRAALERGERLRKGSM